MGIKPEREPVSRARATKEALVQRLPSARGGLPQSLVLKPAQRFLQIQK